MRKGIMSAGNWIVDYVKTIVDYPKIGNLTTICSETTETLGGCSHNVLADLAKMKTGIPLYAGGIIRDDAAGEFIINALKSYGVDSSNMIMTDKAATSYTDVMQEAETGRRTFFHYRGTNALLDVEHFVKMDTDARIFHLGYLLLLDRMDAPDAEYGTVAARVLDMLTKKGYKTSVDMVSIDDPKVPSIVMPCLPYIDYFIVNEVETAQCTRVEVRNPETNQLDKEKLKEAARMLINGGVREVVVIHYPEGSFALRKSGESLELPSYPIDKKEIVGNLGAGDAFCSGCLYGLHEGWSLYDVLSFASANAWFNLHHATATEGQPSIDKIQQFLSTNKL